MQYFIFWMISQISLDTFQTLKIMPMVLFYLSIVNIDHMVLVLDYSLLCFTFVKSEIFHYLKCSLATNLRQNYARNTKWKESIQFHIVIWSLVICHRLIYRRHIQLPAFIVWICVQNNFSIFFKSHKVFKIVHKLFILNL